MLHEGYVDKVIIYLNNGNDIKDITFTEIESVSEHNNERGSLALEINHFEDVKTRKRAKNIFVLTNNNVIGYKIVYKSSIWP